MKRIRFALGSFLLVAFFASVSMAQVQRAFVSGLGSDANPCTRTAPCRTFGAAIGQTNAGGEVYVLDSAGYGPFTIGKSISIVAPHGVTAGISVFSGDGIDIFASATDTVILRGLTINNQGSTGSGINTNTAGTLQVDNCVVNGFSSGSGILITSLGTLEVKDSIIRGNQSGIFASASAPTSFAVIDQTRFEGNSSLGLTVFQGWKAVVRNSIALGNGTAFEAFSLSSAAAELTVENCVATNNADGVFVQSNSTGVALARVSNSTIIDNGVGLNNTGAPAVLLSRGNNTLEGNTTQTSGTIGSYTAK